MATPTQKHSTHLALSLCQDWIRRLKLVYLSRWLFFWKACNLNCICLRSRLNLLSKQRSNYSNQIPLISLKLQVSIKAEEELKKKKKPPSTWVEQTPVACDNSHWLFHKGSNMLWSSWFVRFYFALSIKEDVPAMEWLYICMEWLYNCNQISFKAKRVNFQFSEMLVERKFCLT